MVFRNLRVLVLWAKVASVLEGSYYLLYASCFYGILKYFHCHLYFFLFLIFQVFTTSDHERPENPHENPCNIFTATYFSPVFCIPGIYLLQTWAHPKPTWEPRISTITEHQGWGHIEIHRGRHRRAPTHPTPNTAERETKWTGPSFLSLTIKVAGRVSRTAPRKSSLSSPICQQGKKARLIFRVR